MAGIWDKLLCNFDKDDLGLHRMMAACLTFFQDMETQVCYELHNCLSIMKILMRATLFCVETGWVSSKP